MAESKVRGQAARLGCISISIAGDPSGAGLPSAKLQSSAVQAVLAELIDQFQRHKLPASWAFLEPAAAIQAGRLLASGLGHELALQAGGALSQAAESRAGFVRGTIEPMRRAAAAGLSITSMVMADAWRPRHLDVLAKYGLKIVCSSHMSAPAAHENGGLAINARQRGEGVQAVCYGLWHLPVCFTLHGGGWMANHAQMRLARRAIDGVVLAGGFAHCRIDVESLARGDAAVGLRHIDRLLRELAQLRSGGRLEVRPLRGIAELLQPRRTAMAARSILRAA